ncbi:hypothetical protein ACFL5H_02430 [Candidatus Latescibacterota bacterium]
MDEECIELHAPKTKKSEKQKETAIRIVKKIRIKLHDKVRALDSMAKHLGMFVEHAAEVDPPIPVAVNIIVQDGRRKPDTVPPDE